MAGAGSRERVAARAKARNPTKQAAALLCLSVGEGLPQNPEIREQKAEVSVRAKSFLTSDI